MRASQSQAAQGRWGSLLTLTLFGFKSYTELTALQQQLLPSCRWFHNHIGNTDMCLRNTMLVSAPSRRQINKDRRVNFAQPRRISFVFLVKRLKWTRITLPLPLEILLKSFKKTEIFEASKEKKKNLNLCYSYDAWEYNGTIFPITRTISIQRQIWTRLQKKLIIWPWWVDITSANQILQQQSLEALMFSHWFLI